MHLLGIPSQDFQVLRTRAVLLVDGAGSGNTVDIDIQDDGATIMTTEADFVTADPTDAINSEGVVDSAKSLIAKDSLIQLSLTSSGTITAGHKVGVTLEGHYVD